MSAQPAPAELDATGQHAADAQYYRRVLHDLIDMGTGLARALYQQATQPQATPPQTTQQAPAAEANAPQAPAPDLALAFERVARTVRRTIMLAQKLAEPTPPARPGLHRVAARKRIIRDVEDAIQRSSAGAAAGALHAELLDRLDAPDLDDDIGHRPVADIVADICQDLGVAALSAMRLWKRRTPQDIEHLCARAAAPAGAARPAAGSGRPPAPPPVAPTSTGSGPPPHLVEAHARVMRYASRGSG